ncbi:MAG: nucleotide pyrophosphohydrolase [Armatimonadetes bacterium]|nr:nucleotide pyrophosphohydrolase [Armatimonadota bacterium]MDI9601872.1 MazG nucleotide pyrophosphohydrolase domain-containing protein [Acidobacteriota bacterium]NLN91452.1 nucleotide pyrophosphohydrolase [candidate division WS1 bacterium]
MNLREFQERIGETYLRKDSDRGLFESYAWLVEEIGELAGALRHGRPEDLTHEFSDCLAWLASLANMAGVDLETAALRYADGCPRCSSSPCLCQDSTH